MNCSYSICSIIKMSLVNSKCQVCRDVSAKYKCPKCRLKYCSVSCYKGHQESGCVTLQPKPPCIEMEVDDGSLTSQLVLFPTDDTVMPATLQKLSGSCKLRDLLKNPHLRAMLKEVDKSPNTDATIQSAMMEPIFTEFADEVLSVVEPSEEDRDSDSEED